MVIVDSDVWSEVFRCRSAEPSSYTNKLESLILKDEVVIIGAIRQEVLSGIKNEIQFDKVKHSLKSFPDVPLTEDVYEIVASFYNRCRSNGVQGPHTDFLICACSAVFYLDILSKDREYEHYSEYLPIRICHR
ncbi:PIN domain nuclease [bacterium]|nr:PIN domain nuclease [bacterium]